MRLLTEVSPDLVVARWLQAELHSPRFTHRVKQALQRLRLSEQKIERPNLTSVRENFLRQTALHLYRGDIWGVLPKDTTWWRAEITPQEFQRFRVINYPTWSLLSRGTGLLSEAAALILRGKVPSRAKGRWVEEAAAVIENVLDIRDRTPLVEIQDQLIVMGRPQGKVWTIVEGNKRATALYIRCFRAKREPFPESLRVLMGFTAEPFPWLRLTP
jgi:hypothetical protein